MAKEFLVKANENQIELLKEIAEGDWETRYEKGVLDGLRLKVIHAKKWFMFGRTELLLAAFEAKYLRPRVLGRVEILEVKS